MMAHCVGLHVELCQVLPCISLSGAVDHPTCTQPCSAASCTQRWLGPGDCKREACRH